MTAVEQEKALAALARRKQMKVIQIDNSSPSAGAPMYYYCRLCPFESDVRSEGDFSRVTHYCTECQKLIAAGWSAEKNRFIAFRTEQCYTCGGSGKISQLRRSFGRTYMHERGCSDCRGEGTIKIEE